MSLVKVQFVHYMTGENSLKIVKNSYKNSWKTPGICLVKMSGHTADQNVKRVPHGTEFEALEMQK